MKIDLYKYPVNLNESDLRSNEHYLGSSEDIFTTA